MQRSKGCELRTLSTNTPTIAWLDTGTRPAERHCPEALPEGICMRGERPTLASIMREYHFPSFSDVLVLFSHVGPAASPRATKMTSLPVRWFTRGTCAMVRSHKSAKSPQTAPKNEIIARAAGGGGAWKGKVLWCLFFLLGRAPPALHGPYVLGHNYGLHCCKNASRQVACTPECGGEHNRLNRAWNPLWHA